MEIIKTISEPALYLLSWVVAGIILLFSVFLILSTFILTIAIMKEMAIEVKHGTLSDMFGKYKCVSETTKKELEGIINGNDDC